ncbi:MAG TPA: hypothetical protein VG963_05085 [Polyangiaceae bacterium]|nr:hypothetical protein [Polyangiaceae bacterium]
MIHLKPEQTPPQLVVLSIDERETTRTLLAATSLPHWRWDVEYASGLMCLDGRCTNLDGLMSM